MTENQSIVYQLERTACQSERTACQPELVSGSTPDCIDEMLKRVQHDKIEEFSRTKKNQRNVCQPELVSGSNEMVKRVLHDKKSRDAETS